MYKNFFNYSNELLFITDGSGDLLDVNDAFCRALGYDKGQVISKNIKELLHVEDEIHSLKVISELSDEIGNINFKSRFVTLDGSYITLNCIAYLDIKTGNIATVSQILIEDIAKVEFVNAKEEVAALVTNMAHEINNPLGIISGYTELIKSQPSLDDTTNDKLDVILQSCERIANTIKKLKQDYCSDGYLAK